MGTKTNTIHRTVNLGTIGKLLKNFFFRKIVKFLLKKRRNTPPLPSSSSVFNVYFLNQLLPREKDRRIFSKFHFYEP